VSDAGLTVAPGSAPAAGPVRGATAARIEEPTRQAAPAAPPAGADPSSPLRGPLGLMLPAIGLQSLTLLIGSPVDPTLSAPQALAAFGLVAGGAWTIRSAARELDWNATPACVDEPARALVTTGPYARSRHPMYLGAVAVLAGVAVVLGSPWAGLVALAYAAWVDRRALRAEDARLAAAFGPAWRAYAARVRRWL